MNSRVMTFTYYFSMSSELLFFDVRKLIIS